MSHLPGLMQKMLLWLQQRLTALATRLISAGRLSREDTERRLDEALARCVRTHVHSAVMWVDDPRHGVSRGFAHGCADVPRSIPMTVNTPFYSASVGKLCVAAAVHRLIADGRLSLSDTLTSLVRAEEVLGLPVVGGDEALGHITVAHLLSHRSGLPDYFSDRSRDGAPRLFDRMTLEPDRRWTRPELLDYARAHYTAVSAPGQAFHYADTNYDLLGLILESVTSRPFHAAVRELVLRPLALAQTWYHAFEAPPPGLVQHAEVWINGTSLRDAAALSADQAGGGLITTVHDLRALMRGLVNGRPVPLALLASDFTRNAMHAGIDVGTGAWRIRPGGVFFLLAGMPVLVGHSGATGVWAYYVGDWDAVLVGAVSDARWQERHLEFLLRDVVPVLSRTARHKPPPGNP